MPAQKSIEINQNIYTIYLASYKKYKYWFAAFYFVSIIFWLLMYNENISNKIDKYKEMKNFINEYDAIMFFIPRIQPFIQDNVELKLKTKFKYNDVKDGHWKKKVPQTNAKQYKVLLKSLHSLNKYTDNTFTSTIDSSINILKLDSVLVENAIIYYDSLMNLDRNHGSNNQERQLYRNKIRTEFLSHINESYHKNLFRSFPIQRISNYVVNRYSIPYSILTLEILNQKKIVADSIVQDVENWQNKDLINPQYFRVPLSFETTKNYFYPILVIIALFLHYQYVNFKFYESKYQNNKMMLTRVPTLNNIVDNLKIPIISHATVFPILKLFSVVINYLLPVWVLYILGIKIWKLIDIYALFYSGVIIYIMGFSFLLIYLMKSKQVISKLKNLFKNIIHFYQSNILIKRRKD